MTKVDVWEALMVAVAWLLAGMVAYASYFTSEPTWFVVALAFMALFFIKATLVIWQVKDHSAAYFDILLTSKGQPQHVFVWAAMLEAIEGRVSKDGFGDA